MYALRGQGRKLCEFTKLAVGREIKSKQVLAALFHNAFIYSFDIQNVYRSSYRSKSPPSEILRTNVGFCWRAETRINRKFKAPAVLLRLELGYVRNQIARFGGKPGLAASEKSLYPFAFSSVEEAGISNRLAILS